MKSSRRLTKDNINLQIYQYYSKWRHNYGKLERHSEDRMNYHYSRTQQRGKDSILVKMTKLQRPNKDNNLYFQ